MVAIPLSRWADRQLAELARTNGASSIAAIDGQTLLGERAMLGGFLIGANRSAGGGCRMLASRDGHIAINLSRPDDGDMLPALFGIDSIDASDGAAIAREVAHRATTELVNQGRLLGLAIAGIDERPASQALSVMAEGPHRDARDHPPLIIDLSSLWAGPLASHLLSLSGARAIKVESRNRADRMREGDPALFDLLHQHKDNVAIDLRDAADRTALIALIGRADVVIEAARPRALLQLGIDADAMVRATPGLVWLTITGHGVGCDGLSEAGGWIGFGDDTGVAGGLSAAMRDASGAIGFVGDAIGDPLTGIYAARAAAARLASGDGARLILSMSAIVAKAIADERAADAAVLTSELRQWATWAGQPFPAVTRRWSTPASALGADNQRWLT